MQLANGGQNCPRVLDVPPERPVLTSDHRTPGRHHLLGLERGDDKTVEFGEGVDEVEGDGTRIRGTSGA